MIWFALIIIAVVSAIFYYHFKEALKERTWLQLSSVKSLKTVQIRQELSTLMDYFQHFSDTEVSLADQRRVLFEGFVQADTAVHSFQIKRPALEPGEIHMQDLTDQSSTGKLLVALWGNFEGITRLAIVEPEIGSILTERTGLGETGESYLVGQDFKMRSASRFFPEANPLTLQVRTTGVLEAMKGIHGTGLFPDYRGVNVFSAYGPVSFLGIEWSILSEIDEAEALFPLEKVKRNLVIILVLVFLFVLVASYLLSNELVKPLLHMENRLRKMALGEFESNKEESHRGDEIGQMFRALEKLVSGLEEAVLFAEVMGSGDFTANYVLLGPNDKLGTALIRMKDRLKTSYENEQRLKLENQRSLVQGEDKERTRLSRELHDGLGPLLTILRLRVQTQDIEPDTKAQVLQLIDSTINELRRISNNLMPSVLKDFGAGEAIRNLVKQIQQDNLQVNYVYERNPATNLPESVDIALYRVAQEAINNAVKHSRASKLNISLTEFEDRVSLFLKDNGQGFDSSTVKEGNGLRNMRERVTMENGIFELNSDEQGTSIEVEIPLA